MIKRIVVPVDFSENSKRAARYAVEELAPQLGASVVFVTVLEVSDLRVAMSHGLHGFETDEDVHRLVRAWVEEQFAALETGQGSVKATRDVRRGLPEREIVEAIHQHSADLVVMGAHGIGGRNPIGTKAEHVLAQGNVPLLLLGGAED
jgi:nucleotide-binding universal stress UspA family protein